MNRLDQLKKQITNVHGVYKFQETKKEVIDFYTKNEVRVNSISEKQFTNYSFLTEVLKKCEAKEKLSKTGQIINRVYRLERHSYAPELNTLHFINKGGEIVEINTPSKISIKEAVDYLITTFSITQIQNLILKTNINK